MVASDEVVPVAGIGRALDAVQSEAGDVPAGALEPRLRRGGECLTERGAGSRGDDMLGRR